MEQINTCNVLFHGDEKKTYSFFPAKKTVDACREVVGGHHPPRLFSDYLAGKVSEQDQNPFK